MSKGIEGEDGSLPLDKNGPALQDLINQSSFKKWSILFVFKAEMTTLNESVAFIHFLEYKCRVCFLRKLSPIVVLPVRICPE